jgi:hypothetical protein
MVKAGGDAKNMQAGGLYLYGDQNLCCGPVT